MYNQQQQQRNGAYSQFQQNGSQIMNFNRQLQYNQQNFLSSLDMWQSQTQARSNQMGSLLQQQAQLLLNLQQNSHVQFQQRPPPLQTYSVSLKSINLKPLEYYSQQVNNVAFQRPPQPPITQIQRPQQKVYMETRTPAEKHGFTMFPPQQSSIEVQTDDNITQFKKIATQKSNISRQFSQHSEKVQLIQQVERPLNIEIPEEPEQQQEEKVQVGKIANRKRYKKLPKGMTSKQRGQINFRLFKCSIRFLLTYWVDYKKRVELRKIEASQIKGTQAVNSLHGFLKYFKEAHGKTIIASKQDMFVSDKRKVNEMEMKKRVENLKQAVRRLIFTLVDQWDAKKIGSEQLDFFASITSENQFLPPNFLFSFEINRFEFNSFGALKTVTIERQRMLALSMYLIRVYLFRLIIKPWIDFPEIKKKESLVQNCFQVGSVIYELIVDYIRKKCYAVGQNQAHLTFAQRNNPRDLGPLVLERFELPDDLNELRVLRESEEPLILGLDAKADFKPLLDDLAFCKEMEAYLEEWADGVCDMAHIRWELRKEEEMRLRQVQKVSFIQNLYNGEPNELRAALELANEIALKDKEKKRNAKLTV